MKIRVDISDEFADLATTWYQRYVIYRLESDSSTKPWKPFVWWISIMVLGSLYRLPFAGMWWYYLVMTMIFTATIGEIYFFRVVLAMMRECSHKESRSAQQAVSSDGHKPSCFASTTGSTAPADAL